MKRATLLTLACLLIAGVVAAADVAAKAPAGDIHFAGPDGKIQRGSRCAAPIPTAAEMAAVRAQVDPYLRNFAETGAATTNIPVRFHVVYYNRRGTTLGNVPQSQIDDQIAVLNAAYSGHGFSFTLASTDRTKQNKWFNGCYSQGQERRMKQNLTIDPAHNLNIYTCNPSGGILGWAYFPWSAAEDSYWHGVVLLYSSLPGGGAVPYDEGDTGTHEVGHYLGLYHTFQNGCSAPGDEIDDTPYEASPAFGCPVGRDTCPQAGLDPIFNFMDYTDDACMDEFTGDQATRMQTLTALYRPSL